MLKGLLKVLNVESGEEKPVLLLLGNGFFMGVFLAAYKIVAYTLFLDLLGEHLREAIFISGGLGIISTGIYAYAQRRIPFSRLIVLNYITIFIFIAVMRVLYVYSEKTWVIFVLYVMHAPIMSILLLGFWGTFGRIFDLRQSKRIIGGIDSGQLTATIIAFFTIPFLVTLMSDLSDLLVIGEVGIVISAVFLIVIISNFNLNLYDVHKIRASTETKFGNLIKNKYVVFLSLFLFFSMLAFSFVEYSFLNVAEQQFPEQNKLVNFISTIEGSILVIGLLVQTFVNERLISMYGLKTTLVILPIILTLITGLAIFSGYYFGYLQTAESFIWFFLFITLSKLFTSSLRDAMENPVFKLFFMPLDDKVRFDIQTRIEGLVNESSRLIAGALIFLLGLLPFFELIHYSILLVFIIVGWFLLALRIYQNYRVSIRFKLERQKRKAGREITKHSKNYIFNLLIESTKSNSPDKLVFSFKVLAKLFPFEFKNILNKLANSKSADVMKLILTKLREDEVLSDEDLESSAGKQKDEKIDHSYLSGKDVNFIISLIKDAKVDQKKMIAEYVGHANPDDGFKVIIELFNDSNADIVNAAILASGNLKRMELLPFLVDFLTQEKYRDSATDALINYGEKAFGSLETAFYSTDQSEDVKLRIVGIYGRVGGGTAIKYLWNKIDFPDFKIIASVINALSQCGFKAHGGQITRIKSALENDISNILWNLIALEQLREWRDNQRYAVLINALEEENAHNYTHIYMLLSMIFDQKSIQLVKENIESRTNEGTTYALELLDVFLPEDIKQKIIPILDDIPDQERVRKLQIHFPQIELGLEEILKAIVNRDYSQTNRWTKTCAFYCIRYVKSEVDFSLELVANLFNPDELIRETAAWTLFNLYPALYRQNIGRLPEDDRVKLNNKIMEPFDGEEAFEFGTRYLKYSLIEFLKHSSSLGNLTGLFLSRLVDNMQEFRVNKDFEVDLVNYRTNFFFFILEGEVVLFDTNYNVEKKFKKGGYLGEFIFPGNIKKGFKLFMKEGTMLLQIEKNRYYDIVCDEYDITERILESLNESTSQEVKVETA